MVNLPTFTMPFDPKTINHLGLRLYSSLPPVISELVSNAFDAESEKVTITVPTGPIEDDSEVVIRDWGHGMNAQELQNEYLPIGRNRRGPASDVVMSKNGKRRVLGRKGLGKLSAFGVAREMEIRSVKRKHAICVKINYDSMLLWAADHPLSDPYQPELVRSRSGRTRDDDGVEICLRFLRRKTPIGADDLRRGLARRLYVIGRKFEVRVNDVPVRPSDRVRRSECGEDYSWDVAKLPNGGAVAGGHSVEGWLGFTPTSSQIGRGINVVAHGKAVELGSFFNYPTTHAQFARAHFVGEIHADFLDDAEDFVATARNSVMWESEAGLALQAWGHEAIRWSFEKWLELRTKEKSEKVIKAAGFDNWLKGRPKREQRIATKMVRLLVDDPKIETESAVPLLEIVKSSVESAFFHDLVDAISVQGTDVSTLLTLFDEWRIIEARSMLKLADGRVEAMDKLRAYIDKGALEVQQIQPLLEENLWLLNPKWTEADGQTTYTDLLRRNCKEPKDYSPEERRIDIMGVSVGGGLTIVEIKRPEKTLSRRDLDQAAQYVDWARNQFGGEGPHAPKYIDGLLVVGALSRQGDIQEAMRRLKAADIRVETYRDLHQASKEYYGHTEHFLKQIAPEYMKARTKKATKPATVQTGKRGSTKAEKGGKDHNGQKHGHRGDHGTRKSVEGRRGQTNR